MYIHKYFFCGGLLQFLKGVIKQNARLRTTVNDLPDFAMNIDNSLENNDISLTTVQTVSNPNSVSTKPWHSSVFWAPYLWKNS